MQFTTVRSKEKDYDIYLKSEKLVHSQQENEKNVSQLFRSGKNWFLALSSLTNTVAAIWREKKVGPCYLETKKCSSQLLGTRKKIMTSIISQKNWFTASRSSKKMFPSYLLVKKNWFLAISSLTNTVAAIFWREKSGSLLYGGQKMQFTTVRKKVKDYDIYIKSEKIVHSQQELEKNVSQLFGSGKNWFLAISSLTNTVAAIWRQKKVYPCYLETKKCSSQLLGARKKIMTSI